MLGLCAGRFLVLAAALAGFDAGHRAGPGNLTIGSAWMVSIAPSHAPESEQSASNAFEVIVIDWEATERAQTLADSMQLRFPDAKLRVWSANQGDLEPPFVMVQVRPRPNAPTVTLRLLTHEGAVYTREVADSSSQKKLDEQITRELTSTLLAIAEGLLEPDEQGVTDAKASSASPDTAPVPKERGSVVAAPLSPGPEAQLVRHRNEPLRAAAEPEKWRAWLGLVGGGALPLPAFPSFSVGGGLQVGLGRSLGRWDLEGTTRWITRAKTGARLHRIGVGFGAGTHWMPRSKLRYALIGQAQLEAWWVGALAGGHEAMPRPKGSQVLLGLGIEQNLTFQVHTGSGGSFWLGPQLWLGYAGLVGQRFSALGVYFKEPEVDANALVRLGGLEMTLGLRASFFRY